MSDFGLGGGSPGLGAGASLVNAGVATAVGARSSATSSNLGSSKSVDHGYYLGTANAPDNVHGPVLSHASRAATNMQQQQQLSSSSQKMMLMMGAGGDTALATATVPSGRHLRAMGANTKTLATGGHTPALRLGSSAVPRSLGPTASTSRGGHAHPLPGGAAHHNMPTQSSRTRPGHALSGAAHMQEPEPTHMLQYAEAQSPLYNNSATTSATPSRTAHMEKRQREARQNLIKVTDVRQITGIDTRPAANGPKAPRNHTTGVAPTWAATTTTTATASSSAESKSASGGQEADPAKSVRHDSDMVAIDKSSMSPARHNVGGRADLRQRRSSMDVPAGHSHGETNDYGQAATAHGDVMFKPNNERHPDLQSPRPRELAVLRGLNGERVKKEDNYSDYDENGDDSNNNSREKDRRQHTQQRKDQHHNSFDTISTSSLPNQRHHTSGERGTTFDGDWRRAKANDHVKWLDMDQAPSHRSNSALYPHARAVNDYDEPDTPHGMMRQPHSRVSAADGSAHDRPMHAKDASHFAHDEKSYGPHARGRDFDHPTSEPHAHRQSQRQQLRPHQFFSHDGNLDSLSSYNGALDGEAPSTNDGSMALDRMPAFDTKAEHTDYMQQHQKEHPGVGSSRSSSSVNNDDRERGMAQPSQDPLHLVGVRGSVGFARNDGDRSNTHQPTSNSRLQTLPLSPSSSPPLAPQQQQQGQQQQGQQQQGQQQQGQQQPLNSYYAPQVLHEQDKKDCTSITSGSLYHHNGSVPESSLVISRLVQAQAQLAMRLDAAETEIALSRDTIERQRLNEQRLRTDLAELARVTDARLRACEEGLHLVERPIAEALERSLHATRQGAALSDQADDMASSQRRMRLAIAAARRRLSKPAIAVWGVALCDTELYSCLPCDYERMIQRRRRRAARRQRTMPNNVDGNNQDGHRSTLRPYNTANIDDNESAYNNDSEDGQEDSEESKSYGTDDEDDNIDDEDEVEGIDVDGDDDTPCDRIDIVVAEKGSWHVVHYPSCQATDADGRPFVWMRTVSVDPSTSLCRF